MFFSHMQLHGECRELDFNQDSRLSSKYDKSEEKQKSQGDI